MRAMFCPVTPQSPAQPQTLPLLQFQGYAHQEESSTDFHEFCSPGAEESVSCSWPSLDFVPSQASSAEAATISPPMTCSGHTSPRLPHHHPDRKNVPEATPVFAGDAYIAAIPNSQLVLLFQSSLSTVLELESSIDLDLEACGSRLHQQNSISTKSSNTTPPPCQKSPSPAGTHAMCDSLPLSTRRAPMP